MNTVSLIGNLATDVDLKDLGEDKTHDGSITLQPGEQLKSRSQFVRIGAVREQHPKRVATVRFLGARNQSQQEEPPITDLAPFRSAFARVAALIAELRQDGLKITRADLGGGLGVSYRNDSAPPDAAAYGQMIAQATKAFDVELIFEPGRLIAANAGILVSRVLYVKDGEAKKFLIVDAGMNDLLRPALYDAQHDIIPVTEPGRNTGLMRYDVVGPVCETTDIFARDRDLPEAKGNDLMAIMTAGAYGAVMASAYNTRPPAPEIIVNGRDWCVVRPRITLEALVALDKVPGWLEH